MRLFFIALPTCYLAELILAKMLGSDEIKQSITQQLLFLKETPTLFLTLGAAVIFFSPIIEETLFRGYLQSWIQRRWGAWVAMIGTAAVFASFHIESKLGFDNIQILIPIFILGLFLSYLREKSGSLWAPVGLHTAFNTISFIVLSVTL